MTRLAIVALIALVLEITLTGCARDVGGVSPRLEASSRTTMSEEPSGPTKPPDSTVILGKHTVTGVLGSYCWWPAPSATEAVARCADAAGIPVPAEDEALIVPREWVLVFDYGGRGRPTSVDAGAYPLDREKGSLTDPDGGALLEPGEGRPTLESEDLRVSRVGDRAQIPVKLAAGEYVIEVSVWVPEGDATYYFRVVVV
jgi:hypothetical protein